MKYFIKTIQDIEDVFVPNFETLFIPTQKLGDIRDELTECLYPYVLENKNDDKSKKILIDCEEFILGNELYFTSFCYDCLSKTMDKRTFETKINQIIRGFEKIFITEKESEIYFLNTNANQKLEIKKFIDEVELTIEELTKLEVNDYQNIVKKLFCKSYINVIDDISIKYEDVFPDYFDKLKIQITEINKIYQTHFKDISELNYFIYPDNQVKFKKYEKELISKGYLNEQLVWIKKNNDLVRLYKHLKNQDVFIETKGVAALKSLQERYYIDLGKFDQPARIEKITDPRSKFSFLY